MIKYPYIGQAFEKGLSPSISKETQLEMFYSMLRIRKIEEEIERRYKEDEMKTPIHLVIGQEASCVGPCTALKKSDHVYSGHRTHGVYLAKGGNFKAMMAELYCRTTGCAGSRGGSMHLFDIEAGMPSSSAICGGIIPIATGAALASQMKKEDRVITVFLGDGAAEEGAVWESLNFAALWKLPIVYVCENNFFSVCTPLEKRQPPETKLFKKAEAFGLKASFVDGLDINQCLEASQKAVEHARSGKGPSFLEITAYRWRAHGGFGDDSITGYRDLDEVQHWQAICPIELHYKALKEAALISDSQRESMELEIRKEIEEAFEFARNSPNPKESDLYTHVYAP